MFIVEDSGVCCVSEASLGIDGQQFEVKIYQQKEEKDPEDVLTEPGIRLIGRLRVSD